MMFRILKRSDPLLQQFEIIDKENTDPRNENKRNTFQKETSMPIPSERDVLEQAFNSLMDEMQIPPNLRPKLKGMDPIVKSAMLRSSRQAEPSGPQSPRTLRRTKSSEGLGSPRGVKAFSTTRKPNSPASKPSTSLFTSALLDSSVNIPDLALVNYRGLTLDNSTSAVKSTLSDLKTRGLKDLSAERVNRHLSQMSSTRLDPEMLKKLRLLLRNETTGWTEDFMKVGGYSTLLTRLNEILEVEWREEQHDDLVLYELLRCLKALTTSSIGCFALRSQCPRPFSQLVALLYSDKKPGDLCCRQVIVELLLTLFDLYSPSITHSGGKPPAPHSSVYSLVRTLLLTRRPPSAEALLLPDPVSPHDFISSIHHPRIFKTYLQELSDVCRDYFWIFCHPQNTIWILADVDEAKVEKPKAPGGMTGGVEYEAMIYLTMHLKLINALCMAALSLNDPFESELSYQRLISDLFASGIERILLTSRKASTTYYPALHLELARCIEHARKANFELPWTLSRVLGAAPSNLRRNQVRTSSASPAKLRTSVPMLPSPCKAEPIQM